MRGAPSPAASKSSIVAAFIRLSARSTCSAHRARSGSPCLRRRAASCHTPPVARSATCAQQRAGSLPRGGGLAASRVPLPPPPRPPPPHRPSAPPRARASSSASGTRATRSTRARTVCDVPLPQRGERASAGSRPGVVPRLPPSSRPAEKPGVVAAMVTAVARGARACTRLARPRAGHPAQRARLPSGAAARPPASTPGWWGVATRDWRAPPPPPL